MGNNAASPILPNESDRRQVIEDDCDVDVGVSKRHEEDENDVDDVLKELGVAVDGNETVLSKETSEKIFENMNLELNQLLARPLRNVPATLGRGDGDGDEEAELMRELDALEEEVDAEEVDDMTLCRVAAEGQSKRVLELLKKGADPSRAVEVPSAPSSTWTPLCAAAAGGHLDVVRILLEHGAECYGVTKPHGNTALHYASRLGRVEVVRFLTKVWGMVGVPNHLGLTPAADHLLRSDGDDSEMFELLSAPPRSETNTKGTHVIRRGPLDVDLSRCLSAVGHSASPVYVGWHYPQPRQENNDMREAVAVKIVPRHMWTEIRAEISAITALGHHTNLNNIVHVEKCSMNTLIASPFCESGDLGHALQSCVRQKSSSVERYKVLIDMCRQIADGLNHLHKNGYAHRDMKPENILIHIDKTGRVNCRLADCTYRSKMLSIAPVSLHHA